MSTSKPRKINGLFVLVATVGILFGSAGPAAAGHLTMTGGATNGVGYELGPNFARLCSDTNNQFTGAYFSTTYYLITHSSATYLIKENGAPVAYYSGPISINAQHAGAILGPQGGKPAVIGDCVNGPQFTPSPIPLTKATILGQATVGGVTGYVNCLITNNGSYLRVNSEIDITVDANCTVKGNMNGLNAEKTAKIRHDFVGVQTICQDVPAPGCTHPDAGSKLTGSTVMAVVGHF